jgi:4-hydroxyacetophenone monooxygenase
VRRAQLEAAVAAANVPVLLMVLVHLTGDLAWLRAPYLPTRPKGMDDHDTGGLPEGVRDEVRRHAVDAIARVWEGAAPAVEDPDEALLERMLSVCMGESVPPVYARMMRTELRGAPAVPETTRATRPPAPAERDPTVLVVGAGVSGICAAIKLRDAGFHVEVAEKEADLGGTWGANRYPGCGVDTPSHLYSYSFAPHRWPTYFAQREHVEAYLRRVVDDFGIGDAIRFGTEVVEASFDATSADWSVTLADANGRTERRRYGVVITAVGQLNRPHVPAIAGLDRFRGPVFHSAAWPEGLDIRSRRVAVVGTGASAMQIVPAIADDVAELTIFQRSPQWAIDNDNYFRAVPAEVQLLLDRVPYYGAWYRCRLAWIYNDRVHASLQVDPGWPHQDRSSNAGNDAHRRLFTEYIESELGDRRYLRSVALPDYPPFGKRMLIDNGWFRTLTRDHVELVPSAVRRVTERGPVDDADVEHEVDVLVLATGFEAQRLLAPMRIAGRGGRTIREQWGDDDPRAYLGLMVPGFPNFFTLYGPNSNLGHGGSWITIAEAQVHYVVQILHAMRRERLRAVEVTEAAHDRYNAEVDSRHARMIWTHPGMDTWYRNARGRVVTNSPWRIVDYWSMTREPAWEDLSAEPAAARAAVGQR